MEEDTDPENVFQEYLDDIDDEDLEEDETVQGFVRKLANTREMPLSPIDINISRTHKIETPTLKWQNFDITPRKMKITNSGHTILVSAKWENERPYIEGGPLRDKYVFSQMHFHWGAHDMEGSEHSTDGMIHPGEIHVVTYKSCYGTQESALRHVDGIVILVYFLRLKGGDHSFLWKILDIIPDIEKSNTSVKIKPFPLDNIITPINDDYFAYWGSIITTEYSHYVLWFIGRTPVGVSQDQMAYFRKVFNQDDLPMLRNFRELRPPDGRTILYINPSGSQYATLRPLAREEK